MPKVRVPSKYIRILKSLAVYDEWLVIVKDQWDLYHDVGINPISKWHQRYIDECVINYSFSQFITYSFNRYRNNTDSEFWDDICKKGDYISAKKYK